MFSIINLRKLDSLVMAYKEGCRESLDKVIYILRPLIEARAAKVVSQYGKNIEAEDLKQNLYLKILRIIKLWNPERGASFSTYRHKAIESEVAQTIREQLRYASRIETLPDDYDFADYHWEERMESRIKKKELTQLLDKLVIKLGKKSTKAKLIFEAFTIHGATTLRSAEDITGIPKSTIHDCIKSIKLALDDSDKEMLAAFHIVGA